MLKWMSPRDLFRRRRLVDFFHRTDPAMFGNIADDAIRPSIFDLIECVRRVRHLAHHICAAGIGNLLSGAFDLVDPEADVMDADEIRAGALRGLVS